MMNVYVRSELLHASRWQSLLFLISLFWSVVAVGQNYAVQSTVQVMPPYSVYLSDYATSGNEKLRVVLLQRDLSRPAYQLRLVMAVELNGKIILRTSRTYNPPPINLDPGIPTVISGADLARIVRFLTLVIEQEEQTFTYGFGKTGKPKGANPQSLVELD